MKWLRLYNEVLDDPKVQQLHPALFKHWINLLCLASQFNQNGQLPDERSIAFRLRVRPSEVRNILNQLCAVGLLDCDGKSAETRTLFAHNWTGRQRVSDDVSLRVAKHRAGNEGNVTLPETGSNDDGNVLDTDTEKDKELLRSNGRLNGAKPPATKRYSDRFLRFWAAYPRRQKKGDAFKAFEQLRPDEGLLVTMIEAVEGLKRSPQWTKDGGEFIPLPGTWIRAEGWLDEPTEIAAARFQLP